MASPLLSPMRAPTAPITTRDGLVALLTLSAERGASEVHLKVPNAAVMRIRGALVPASALVLAPSDTAAILDHLVVMSGIAMTGRPSSTEFAFGVAKVGRFHVFAYRQRGTYAIVIRRMELEVPTLAQLSLDPNMELGPGLTVSVGRHRLLGLHAMVHSWNQRRAGNVMVLESPLRFLHRDSRAFVSQREVGQEVADFPSGIRDAVRMGCDLLAVGDVPDRATAEALLEAAEREMPVVIALAAPDVATAPWWLARMYDGRQRDDAELRIQNVLRQVIVPERPPTP
jgi:Tfp pilus assembly pilus retraction ATPase PilT